MRKRDAQPGLFRVISFGDLKRVKGFRIAFLTLVFAAALAALQISFRPIHAAQQSAAAGAETSPPAKAGASQESGADEYAKHCAVCHGAGREGNLPGFPPLVGISHRMTNDQIAQLIHAGKGRMPGFPSVQGSELAEILHYLDSTPAPAESGNASEPSAPVAAVVREGRPDNKMPPFNFSSQEMTGLVAFIRARVSAAEAHKGARKGVSVEDLQTGNAEAGKAYFNGAGGCSKCHSPSGDLAGIASRTQGLQLEEQMLSPRGAKSRVTLTDPSGETVSGTLAYRDEFTIALRDASGVYRSWQASSVKFTVDSPVDAHAEQFEKYTDDDIHNLMAYLQTLK